MSTGTGLGLDCARNVVRQSRPTASDRLEHVNQRFSRQKAQIKMLAKRYFGIMNGLAIHGDTLPRGRLCHAHVTAAEAMRCEEKKRPWYNEHDLVTVVKAGNKRFRVVVSRSERLHKERGAIYPRHRSA